MGWHPTGGFTGATPGCRSAPRRPPAMSPPRSTTPVGAQPLPGVAERSGGRPLTQPGGLPPHPARGKGCWPSGGRRRGRPPCTVALEFHAAQSESIDVEPGEVVLSTGHGTAPASRCRGRRCRRRQRGRRGRATRAARSPADSNVSCEAISAIALRPPQPLSCAPRARRSPAVSSGYPKATHSDTGGRPGHPTPRGHGPRRAG